MTTSKKTLKERRMESDARIISSSIKCFGQNGYTHTSISEIAKDAGITPGLITQRFETKENLFNTAYLEVMDDYFVDIDENTTPRECLLFILKEIENLSNINPDAFNFCVMLHNSTDLPRETMIKYKDQAFDKNNVVEVMTQAQKIGLIPQGDVRFLLAAYSANAFHHIKLCKKYGLSIPNTEYYLKAINYVDEKTTSAVTNESYLERQIREAVCKEYQSIWLINIENLTLTVFESNEQKSIPGSIDAAKSIHTYNEARLWYIDNYVDERMKDEVRQHTEIDYLLSKLKTNDSFYVEYNRKRKDKTNYNQLCYDKILAPSGEIEYLLMGFRNIDITKKAEYDDLTGLYTRQAFFRRAEKLMNSMPDKQFDIVISDIVDFKKVNEIYGSAVADDILRWLGKNLIASKTEELLIGRYGGDQMVVIGTSEKIKAFISKESANRFAEAVNLNGLPKFTTKFGVYEDVRKESSIITSCDKAHMALNSIKRHYEKEIAYYGSEIKDFVDKQRRIEASMYDSLKNGDFKVYYQPKHNAKTGKLVGAEALIRWIHPEYGFMSPADFIPLFEQNGFIVENDHYVWKRTCQNLRNWKEKGIKTVPISVNASKLSMQEENLIFNMQKAIEDNGLNPSQLHIEITETLMTENVDELVTKLNQIRELGFKVELDDFGSGYSSLNVLSTLPIDVVKLDMSFMQQFGDEKREKVLVACINLAKELGFGTISEGVELKEQTELLGDLGVDAIQGYFYSKPLPEAEFEEYLIQHLG